MQENFLSLMSQRGGSVWGAEGEMKEQERNTEREGPGKGTRRGTGAAPVPQLAQSGLGHGFQFVVDMITELAGGDHVHAGAWLAQIGR